MKKRDSKKDNQSSSRASKHFKSSNTSENSQPFDEEEKEPLLVEDLEIEDEDIEDEGVDIELDLSKGGEEIWRRPTPPFDNNSVNIAFFQLDTDYCTPDIPNGFRLPYMPEAPGTPLYSPVIRMFGTSSNGWSICAHIFGFLPYFYCSVPSSFSNVDLMSFKNSLSKRLMEGGGKNTASDNPIITISNTDKTSLWGYNSSVNTKRIVKIIVTSPRYVAAARRILEKEGLSINGDHMRFICYEANLPFCLRFMIDGSILGATWLEVHYSQLISHSPVDNWMVSAPSRILSFDIECGGRKGKFPEASIDPIITIANIVTYAGEETPFIRNVFSFHETSPIVGAQVLSYDTEEEMLLAWHKFVLLVDPDIITGEFAHLSRIKSEVTRVKSTKFSSRAYGITESKDFNIIGRIKYDIYPIIRRDFKLSSYTLNNVSQFFLKKTKEDVHHSIITDLWNGDKNTRKRLAEYCIRDAVLPQLLIDKLMLYVNHVEMARVTGVPFSYLLTRGQQIKVVSQLYRKAIQHGFVIPMRDKERSDEKYEGATVIEPEKGYYEDPIATLDFASLYPSIMMAHNLCYTTLLDNTSSVNKDMYEETPTGARFIKKEIRKGLLPEILEELLTARKKAKKEMKEASSPFLKSVLNGRQLALKISANSVYGFTGAQIGQLPCLAISSSVTAFGREMISNTKKLVEEHYSIANGYEHDSLVVYGDTDSVMVRFGVKSVEESIKYGQEAATYITSFFPPPIRIEFEKVYYPFLLMAKKRYAGLLYTEPNTWIPSPYSVRTIIEKSLNKILISRNIDESISDLLNGRTDLSLLVITKSLGKGATAGDYKAKQAHVELAERMRKRDPLSAPGDRVPYLITKGVKGTPAYELSEDPLYCLENDIPIDLEYYLTHQLRPPIERIFFPILGNKISSLFIGEHTRAVSHSVNISSTHGLARFTTKRRTCVGCKCLLNDSNVKNVCSRCLENLDSIYIKSLAKVRGFEKAYWEAWSECQRCQNSLHEEVICGNRDCPIFYFRLKKRKDLKNAIEALKDFDF